VSLTKKYFHRIYRDTRIEAWHPPLLSDSALNDSLRDFLEAIKG